MKIKLNRGQAQRKIEIKQKATPKKYPGSAQRRIALNLTK